MGETIFNEYQMLIMNQVSAFGVEKLEIEGIVDIEQMRIVEEPLNENILTEVDGALKINLQTLINNMSRPLSGRLQKALQSQDKLLEKLVQLKN